MYYWIDAYLLVKSTSGSKLPAWKSRMSRNRWWSEDWMNDPNNLLQKLTPTLISAADQDQNLPIGQKSTDELFCIVRHFYVVGELKWVFVVHDFTVSSDERISVKGCISNQHFIQKHTNLYQNNFKKLIDLEEVTVEFVQVFPYGKMIISRSVPYK